MKVVKPVLSLQRPTFHKTTCICGLSTGLYLTESSIQTKSGTTGENDFKLQYISLLTEALSPYKQELYSSTIRVCKGSRDPREMTNGNKGLRENERRINGRNRKRVCEWKTEMMEQLDAHLSFLCWWIYEWGPRADRQPLWWTRTKYSKTCRSKW